MKLKKDKVSGAYYTEDRIFKIQRCAVRAYGWNISKRREDGTYKIEANAATLPEARKMVIGKGDQK